MRTTGIVCCTVLAAAVVLIGSARGQGVDMVDPNPPPSDHLRQVFWNGAKVKLEIALDREDYLSGEVVSVKYGAFNPNAESVEVFDPLVAAGFDLLKWADRFNSGVQGWEPCTSDSLSMVSVHWNAPTVTFGPGQRVEKQVVYSDRHCSQCVALGAADNPPNEDGKYLLRYCYVERPDTCAKAEFTMAVPTVVASAHTESAEPLRVTGKASGQEKEYPRYFNALIVQSNARRYVVVSRIDAGEFDTQPGPAGKLDAGILGLVEPYDRVAEVSLAVNAIKLAADADDNLTVTWTDENGKPQAYFLSADRSRIEPAPPPQPVQP